jgi:DNA-binding MarR family transcriptional regulator
MQPIDPGAAVAEATRILRLKGLTQDERKILSYMNLANNAFWQLSQIAHGVGLSSIRIRSRLRVLGDAGYVERSKTSQDLETEFRITDQGQQTLS